MISAVGRGRGRSYTILPMISVKKNYALKELDEFALWKTAVAPLLSDLPENLIDIWRYGVTEMVNNAIDHSEGGSVAVSVQRTALATLIQVSDDGEGIFHRIQRLLALYDARESILELAKGKLTTDPEKHSGEGVFFTSRVFDKFSILSKDLFFSHDEEREDWLISGGNASPGTQVMMEIANDSNRTVKGVFDEYAEADDYTFDKTVVPVRLAQHEGEKLVSRSQAKRLALRFEKFKTVVLDFSAIEEIGQAFSDELFRVFKASHPGIEMIPVQMNDAVAAMIRRVMA